MRAAGALLVTGIVAASLAMPSVGLAHGATLFWMQDSATQTRNQAKKEAELSSWSSWWRFNEALYIGRSSRTEATPASEEKIRGVMVPLLLETLKNEADSFLETSCMLALAKIGEVASKDGKFPIADAIRPFLFSEHFDSCGTAALALGILGNRGDIASLTFVLEKNEAELRKLGLKEAGEPFARARAFAAYGLGLIGSKASNEDRIAINATLRRILDGEGKSMKQFDIQVACVSAMGLSPLKLDANDKDGVSIKPPEALTSLQGQLRYLLAYFADESNSQLIRAHAPTAMARLITAHGEPASSPMRDALASVLMKNLAQDSKTPEVMQESCVLALGVLGDCDEETSDRAIRASLMDVNAAALSGQVRNFALIALAQVSTRPGHGGGDPMFGIVTDNKSLNTRLFLVNALANGKPAERPWAGLAVGAMERALQDAKIVTPEETKALLRSTLAAAPVADFGAYAIACGLVRDHETKGTLLAMLAKDPTEPFGWTMPDHYEADPNRKARSGAAIGLGLMGDRAVIAPIHEIMDKSKYESILLKSMFIALRMLDDEGLVQDLGERLSNSKFISLQFPLIKSLEYIGDARCIDPLITFLEDKEHFAGIRSIAAEALGTIADKDDPPWKAKFAANVNYRASAPTLTDGLMGILDEF